MNKPSPSIEAAGLLAYEQAGAYESVQRQRLPLIYFGLTVLYMGGGIAMLKLKHHGVANACFAMAIFLPLFFWWVWRRAEARYSKNLQLLNDLEKTYGEALPWIQVERHFEALEKLKRELEQEKAEEAGRSNNRTGEPA